MNRPHPRPALAATPGPARLTTVLALALTLACLRPAPAGAQPAADPADVASIDAIITAVYDVISGDAGEERDWNRWYSLFAREATLSAVVRRQDGAFDRVIMTPETWVQQSGTVIERDGMIVSCAALYPFDGKGELACLATHPDYRDNDRGELLLEAIENKARAQSLASIFVLTTHTAHWFTERGFKAGSVESLPERRKSLYNWQRSSKLFEKNLQ